MLLFLKKIPPDKIFPRSYMDFEQKYQKDPGMSRVGDLSGIAGDCGQLLLNVPASPSAGY